jgi:hypothetical protein
LKSEENVENWPRILQKKLLDGNSKQEQQVDEI